MNRTVRRSPFILVVSLVLLALSLSVFPSGRASAKVAADRCGRIDTVAKKISAISHAIKEAQGQSESGVAATVERAACVSLIRPSHRAVVRPLVADNDTDMTVSAPTMFYDRETKANYVEALWRWKNNDYSADIPDQSCNVNKSDGGVDGFAVSFSGSVHWLSYTLQHGTNYEKHGPFSKTVAQTANSAGVGFVDQDTIYMDGCNRDNSMFYGDIVGAFTPLNGCKNIDARSSYSHTWSSTAVSSISIGANASGGSIGFGWRSVGHQWTNTSQTSDILRVC